MAGIEGIAAGVPVSPPLVFEVFLVVVAGVVAAGLLWVAGRARALERQLASKVRDAEAARQEVDRRQAAIDAEVAARAGALAAEWAATDAAAGAQDLGEVRAAVQAMIRRAEEVQQAFDPAGPTAAA